MTQSSLDSIQRILAVSSESAPFASWASDAGVEVQVREAVSEAISLAAESHYDLIFVRLHHIRGRIEQSLEAFRRADAACRIILLCSMTEEPIAIRLTQGDAASIRRADDYLIYPGGFAEWARHFIARRKNSAIASSFPTLADSADAMQRLEKMATEDDLTGLKNRRYVRQFLRQILDYARRNQFHVTVLLFDIDNFKQYNDLYGHAVGDEVLRQVGEMMKRCCRAHDVVARVGGDEFTVIFWDLSSLHPNNTTPAERRRISSQPPKEPFFMAERFRRQLSMTKLPSLGTSGKGVLTISGGLASFPDDAKDENQLWEQSDQAMLQAKRSGKNRIHIVGKSAEPQASPLSS